MCLSGLPVIIPGKAVLRPAIRASLFADDHFDILSDLGAGIIGGLGMAPSAEVGEERALFQPSHGSAPDIAGQNKANPIATILSARMMFEWLGVKFQDDAATEVANCIEAAVVDVLANSDIKTADIGGNSSCADVGDAVVAAIKSAR